MSFGKHVCSAKSLPLSGCDTSLCAAQSLSFCRRVHRAEHVLLSACPTGFSKKLIAGQRQSVMCLRNVPSCSPNVPVSANRDTNRPVAMRLENLVFPDLGPRQRDRRPEATHSKRGEVPLSGLVRHFLPRSLQSGKVSPRQGWGPARALPRHAHYSGTTASKSGSQQLSKPDQRCTYTYTRCAKQAAAPYGLWPGREGAESLFSPCSSGPLGPLPQAPQGGNGHCPQVPCCAAAKQSGWRGIARSGPRRWA